MQKQPYSTILWRVFACLFVASIFLLLQKTIVQAIGKCLISCVCALENVLIPGFAVKQHLDFIDLLLKTASLKIEGPSKVKTRIVLIYFESTLTLKLNSI